MILGERDGFEGVREGSLGLERLTVEKVLRGRDER